MLSILDFRKFSSACRNSLCRAQNLDINQTCFVRRM